MGIQLKVRSQSNLPTWIWSGLNQANWRVSSLMLPMTGATTCRLSSAILPSRGSSQPAEFMENKIKFFSQKKKRKINSTDFSSPTVIYMHHCVAMIWCDTWWLSPCILMNHLSLRHNVSSVSVHPETYCIRKTSRYKKVKLKTPCSQMVGFFATPSLIWFAKESQKFKINGSMFTTVIFSNSLMVALESQKLRTRELCWGH